MARHSQPLALSPLRVTVSMFVGLFHIRQWFTKVIRNPQHARLSVVEKKIPNKISLVICIFWARWNTQIFKNRLMIDITGRNDKMLVYVKDFLETLFAAPNIKFSNFMEHERTPNYHMLFNNIPIYIYQFLVLWNTMMRILVDGGLRFFKNFAVYVPH